MKAPRINEDALDRVRPAGRRAFIAALGQHEAWISGLGGLLGIFLVMLTGKAWLGEHSVVFAISSMGSSAVLLFGMPHAPASQPWPVLGGHLVSGVAGVLAVQWLAHDPALAAALAVGGAITVMHLLRCLHPPGGATALYAVLMAEPVSAMGWGYLTGPVMLGTCVMLATAVIWNYPFAWRRYPQAWQPGAAPAPVVSGARSITHSQLVYALSEMDTFMDISEEDLLRIYALATRMPADAPAADSPRRT
jgi:CBS-domain-containing membrane protein